jgi:hypothetical protein
MKRRFRRLHGIYGIQAVRTNEKRPPDRSGSRHMNEVPGNQTA